MNYVRNKKLQSVNGDKCDDFCSVFIMPLCSMCLSLSCQEIQLCQIVGQLYCQMLLAQEADNNKQYCCAIHFVHTFFCFLDQYTEHSFFVMEMPVESIVHFNKGGSIAQENIV